MDVLSPAMSACSEGMDVDVDIIMPPTGNDCLSERGEERSEEIREVVNGGK